MNTLIFVGCNDSAVPTLCSFTYTKPSSFQAIELRPVKDSGFSLRYCSEFPSLRPDDPVIGHQN